MVPSKTRASNGWVSWRMKESTVQLFSPRKLPCHSGGQGLYKEGEGKWHLLFAFFGWLSSYHTRWGFTYIQFKIWSWQSVKKVIAPTERLREEKWLLYGHTAGKWQSMSLCRAPKSLFFSNMLPSGRGRKPDIPGLPWWDLFLPHQPDSSQLPSSRLSPAR